MTPTERQERVKTLKKDQQKVFDAMGLKDVKYIPKMAHHVKGLQGIHMGFFESELSHGEDVYTEMIGINVESEDPSRTLYKYRSNPHFKEELAASEPNSKGTGVRYFIPLDELEVVKMPTKKVTTKKISTKKIKEENVIADTVPEDSSDINNLVDLPLSEMTIRDYISIHTGNPVSNKAWINQIVLTKPTY